MFCSELNVHLRVLFFAARFAAVFLPPFEPARFPGAEVRFDAPFFDVAFLPAFFRGTFAPDFRASESPMAMACFLLFTFLPDRPLLSLPCLRSRIVSLTFSCAFLEYLAMLSWFTGSTPQFPYLCAESSLKPARIHAAGRKLFTVVVFALWKKFHCGDPNRAGLSASRAVSRRLARREFRRRRETAEGFIGFVPRTPPARLHRRWRCACSPRRLRERTQR